MELQQGGNAGLQQVAPGVDIIVVALAWEPERIAGLEVDASAFMLKADGKVRSDDDFIFYNQPKSPDGAMEVRKAVQPPDRQLFTVKLKQVSPDVEKIAFVLTIHGAAGTRTSFSQAQNARIRILAGGGERLAYAPATSGMQESALILGELYRRNNEWKFRAVGQGFAGGLGPLAMNYGVDIAEDPAPSPAAPAPAPSPLANIGAPPPPPPPASGSSTQPQGARISPPPQPPPPGGAPPVTGSPARPPAPGAPHGQRTYAVPTLPPPPDSRPAAPPDIPPPPRRS